MTTALDQALDELAGRRPLLLASDYDGVLARLRDDPAAAVPEPGVGELLARLAAVDGVTVALVSGRGVADLQATSGLTGPFRWVGSHGAEFDGPLTGDLAVRRDQLAAALAPLVEAVPGARLEHKPAGAAVHVRTVADRAAAARLLADVAAGPGADPALTAKPGKDVLELAVTDADKGSALLRLRTELGAQGALYLGDDVTDEDGFRALAPDGVTVKVGDGDTAAAHRVPDLDGVRAVLERLAAALRA
ncbi:MULTISPECIES: trehalose-phosphatase [unclassified Modestobacter]|uniref:trehalose-phosphatase n=1 Tax=unclassified Modestobacter TaxID=2643866 RepID=UPI0022AAE5DB|nr:MULTISPECIES: trehalose-phosphatase [unclassified Modestobacter]MCZ2810991.1 trehalose-phosphatase [Modestobacter sp. VKM Ac-2979]MCZ2840504.1 trehalose-phosphatase [Modestobacter sp. VKM Ac-2980]MCZ2849631.1 trehalose-phosphatase [Modestobacter sp. VKM Ac-2978]